MLTLAYNSKAYDRLGDVREAAKNLTKKNIQGLGEIILSHGYENIVNASLAHSHFALAKTEVIFETSKNSVRIAKPITFDELASIAKKKIEIQPTVIVCDRNGIFNPVAYGIGKLSRAWKDDSFLKAISDYLLKNNLQDKLALSVRNIDDEKMHGFRYLETNFADTRTSESRLVDEKDIGSNTIKTAYGFSQSHEGEVEQFCYFHCRPDICFE